MTSTPYTRGAEKMREAAAQHFEALGAAEARAGYVAAAAECNRIARRIRELALPEEE